MVVDRHSTHRSKAVRDWPADDKDQVELHFLPWYSPALNQDELVNADLKGSPPHTHGARSQAELAAEKRRFFRSRQGQSHIARVFFSGRHVHYVLNERTGGAPEPDRGAGCGTVSGGAAGIRCWVPRRSRSCSVLLRCARFWRRL
ncbi:transposase [Streptomyces sp. SS7]|uniref:transposase n=1 Tax=Streptomyces sp. SS7 TaxID=3108485 RepID=UPI0030EF8780